MLEAIKEDGLILSELRDEFKKDKEIVKLALENSEGIAIEYVDETLQNDPEIIEIFEKIKKEACKKVGMTDAECDEFYSL